jgi:hypothetical protein
VYPDISPRCSTVALIESQSDSAQAALKVALVLSSDQIKVLGERFFHCCGEHRVPVFVPLTGSDYDLVAG